MNRSVINSKHKPSFALAVACVVVLAVTGLGAQATCSQSTLFAGPTSTTGIAVDAGFVYFGDAAGNVRRVPKEGGDATVLAAVSGLAIQGVAVDDERVYFTAVQLGSDSLVYVPGTGSVRAVSKAGGAVTTLASSLNSPVGIALDSTHVYWTSLGTQFLSALFNADGKLQRVAKAGGGVETLAADLALPSISLVLDGGEVYFGENGGTLGAPFGTSAGVRSVAKTGGAVRKITDARPAFALFLSGSTIYFSSGFEGGVYGVPKEGGAVTTLAAGQLFTRSLAVAGEKVYFLQDTDCSPQGSLRAVGRAGGNVEVVKGGLDCPLFATLDSCTIYLTTKAGAVERVCLTDDCSSAPAPAVEVRISSASVSGKKLMVEGANFQAGAIIEIDGDGQKTANDDQSPDTRLIGKKAGKKIRRGDTVTLTVVNPDGTRSAGFSFTRPIE